jgi:hypothetical protein
MLTGGVESKMLRAIDSRDEAVIQTDVTFLTVALLRLQDEQTFATLFELCEATGRVLKGKNARLMRLRSR